MKDQIFFVLVLLALAGALYRCYKTKSERLLYAIFFFASLQIGLYPFWFPLEFSFAFCGFLGFAVMLYKILYKKLDKSLIVFAAILLLFGIAFLLQGLFYPVYTHSFITS